MAHNGLTSPASAHGETFSRPTQRGPPRRSSSLWAPPSGFLRCQGHILTLLIWFKGDMSIHLVCKVNVCISPHLPSPYSFSASGASSSAQNHLRPTVASANVPPTWHKGQQIKQRDFSSGELPSPVKSRLPHLSFMFRKENIRLD